MTLTRALSAVMEMTEAASHRKRLKARQVVNNVEKDIKPDKEPFPTSSGCGKFRYSSTMHSFLSLLVVFVSTVAALPAPINPTPINPIMDKTYFDDCDFDQKHLPITAFYTLVFLTLFLSDVQSPQELTIHSHSLPSPISQDYDVNNTFISYQIRYCSDETQQGPAPQNHIVMALNDFSRQFTDSNEPNLIVREAKTFRHSYGEESGKQTVAMTFTPYISSNDTRTNHFAVNNIQASLVLGDVAQRIKDGERHKNFRLKIRRRDIQGPADDVVGGASVFST